MTTSRSKAPEPKPYSRHVEAFRQLKLPAFVEGKP